MKAKGTTFETRPLLLVDLANQSQGQTGPSTGTPEPTARIVSVSAVNGTITVTFNEIPNNIPQASDFVIERVINDGAAVSVTSSDAVWDTSSKTVTITVPTVPETVTEQSVVERVSYQGAAAAAAAAYVVPAEVIGSNLIVGNGVAKAKIVIDTDASQRTIEAANTFKNYIQKSTGAVLPLVTFEQLTEPSSNDMTHIYIGVSRAEDQAQHQDLLQEMNVHGFIIDSQVNHIAIIGSTDWGTEFGVNEFLERFLGIRWLLPGPEGEDVPMHSTVAIPHELIQDEPATISRSIFFLNTPATVEWGRRNGIHDNIQFHHNLAVLFDPVVFQDHPEYYVGGVVPTHPYEWQPCLNDTTAAVAIQRIKQYFDENPEAGSYSLGINDSTRFCAADIARANGKINSTGSLHMSDVYYPWVNQVVEGVLADEQYKDKYFGLLAYWTMYDPPSEPLHPHVVPYITEDRMTWGDESVAAEGKLNVERWTQAAANIGWYEYLYGSPYNVPRVYMQRMADNYKYAQDQGVIGHVAEMFPNFGEGPKAWVSTKLQWNADQDVNVLLNEWYTSAVGVDAAADLQAYYEIWEHFWTVRIQDSDWYQRWYNSEERYFLRFDQPDYLEEVTKEDITESRHLLEQVVTKAQTSAQKARARKLLRAFEFYEASALSYPRTTPVDAPANHTEALEMLEDIKISFEMVKKRFNLPTQFEGDPILNIPLAPPHRGGSWDGIQTTLIAALESYIAAHPEELDVKVGLEEFLSSISHTNFSANAVKTTVSKTHILNSLDFNQGPWRYAVPFNDFMVMGTRIDVPEKTNVYLLWDDENLYVGYENFDSRIWGMVVSDSAPGSWWSSGGDDSVETFISADPTASVTGFFSNPRDVRFNHRKVGTGSPAPIEDSTWESNSVIKSDRWNTVQVIPFASIGINPRETKELQGFFLRNYHGQKWFLTWGGGRPWSAESFKPVHLVDPHSQEPLNNNASFEEVDESSPSDIKTKDWVFEYYNANRDPQTENAYRTDEVAHTGEYSIAVTGITSGSLVTTIEVDETVAYIDASAYYYTAANTEPGGALVLAAEVFDAAQQPLGILGEDTRQISDTAGEWAELTIQAALPTGAKYLRFQVYHYGIPVGKTVYFDDVIAFGVAAPSVERVYAANGSLEVALNGWIESSPVGSDFTVTQKIDDEEATVLTAEVTAWDAASKTAILAVPPLPITENVHTVIYSVAYKQSAEVSAAPIRVGYLPLNNNEMSPYDIKTKDWRYEYYPLQERNPITERAYRTDEVARTGEHSIAVTGITRGALITMIEIDGTMHDYIDASAYYYTAANADPGGALVLAAEVVDAAWQPLGVLGGDTKQISDTAGEWAELILEAALPTGAKYLRFQIYHHGIPVGKTVYFDDIVAYGVTAPILEESSALNNNISFEEADETSMYDIKTKDWRFSYFNSNRNPILERADRTDEVARTGAYSIAVKGITSGALITTIEVDEAVPAYMDASAYYYTALDAVAGGSLALAADVYDANWQLLGQLVSDTRHISDTAGVWAEVTFQAAIPAGAKYLNFQIYHYGIPVGKTVYFDDVVAYGVSEL